MTSTVDLLVRAHANAAQGTSAAAVTVFTRTVPTTGAYHLFATVESEVDIPADGTFPKCWIESNGSEIPATAMRGNWLGGLDDVGTLATQAFVGASAGDEIRVRCGAEEWSTYTGVDTVGYWGQFAVVRHGNGSTTAVA